MIVADVFDSLLPEVEKRSESERNEKSMFEFPAILGH